MSVHSLEEAVEAELKGADWVIFGPVYDSRPSDRTVRRRARAPGAGRATGAPSGDRDRRHHAGPGARGAGRGRPGRRRHLRDHRAPNLPATRPPFSRRAGPRRVKSSSSAAGSSAAPRPTSWRRPDARRRRVRAGHTGRRGFQRGRRPAARRWASRTTRTSRGWPSRAGGSIPAWSTSSSVGPASTSSTSPAERSTRCPPPGRGGRRCVGPQQGVRCRVLEGADVRRSSPPVAQDPSRDLRQGRPLAQQPAPRARVRAGGGFRPAPSSAPAATCPAWWSGSRVRALVTDGERVERRRGALAAGAWSRGADGAHRLGPAHRAAPRRR